MSSFFPFTGIYETEKPDTTLPLYQELAWDFEKNEPRILNGDFVVVQGKEAIKVWVYKAIKTPRFVHPIYSWQFGCEVEELIGKAYTVGLTKMEATRYIEEALSINEYILNVDVKDVDFREGTLRAYVVVETIYGEVEVSV